MIEIKEERVHGTIDTHKDELLFVPITSLLMFPHSRLDMVQCSVEKSEPTPSIDLLCPRIEFQEKARNLCNFPPTFSTLARIHSFLEFSM